MLALLTALPLLLPQWFGARPLQPYEAHSASGAWTLEVKPSDPSGKGPMRARILHGKDVSWSGEFAWTFQQAGVSEDGTCVGYANLDKLRIAVLDAKGALRKEHAIAHTAAIVDGPSLPEASGPVLVHATADLALIRVHPADQSDPAPWRAFRLSTGESAPDIVPEKPAKLAEHEEVYERDALVVGDTQLVLAHWWYANYHAAGIDWSQDGGIFSLHDLQGRVVWRSLLLDDYTDTTSEKADDALEASLRDGPLLVSAGPGPRFAVRYVKENARVEYSVEKDASGAWNVKEVGRTPWSAETTKLAAAAIESLALEERGRVVLRSNTTKAQHPIHGVMELGFTEQGELELFRREQGTGPSYARVKPDGTLVFERDLTPALPKPDAWPQFHALSGDRWLLQFLDDERPWIQLDVRTGATTSIPLPKGGMSCHVAPFPDGGYVALVPQIVRSLCLTELYAVRADGTIVWKQRVAGVGPDDSAFERAVSFAQGIARTGEHTFALLGMSELTLVDLERNVLKTWKLEDVLGHRPSYMDGLLSDAKGGVLFEEGDAFHHLDANGAQIATFTPKRADGSRDGVMDHLLRVAPDGRMWTSDRERVYRLDDRGVADLVLGPEAKDDELGEADDTAIDALGRVLAQDRSSRSVHVFDAEGRRIAVCKLAPNERPEGYVSAAFHGARDGSVWVTTSAGLAHFDATGTRIPMPVAAKAEDGKRVNRRDARALLDALEPERAALNAMNQRPDGTWLANVTERAVLPDGRRVLLENAEREDAPASLHLYTPAGEPLHTLALPKDTGMRQLSVGARWIVVGDYGPTWTLVRFEDEKVFRFDSKLEDGGNWIPGQTPDGKTLLLLHAGRMELVRFALP